MISQRLPKLRSRLLLLAASTAIALVGMCGEALASVPVNGPGGWQTGGFTVTITDGYSYNNGASMSCSNNNGAYETYYGAGPNSGGVLMEQQWYVPNNGATTFNCTVWNSTRTASDTGSNTFYLDTLTPWANINVGGGTMGANGWYTSFPSVWGSYGNVGPSGTWSSGCGGSYNPGSDWWTCSITDYNNLSGSAGTTINYDPYTPAVSTNVNGGAGANGWYRSAPSITASTSNVGPSGIAGGYPYCNGIGNGSNSITCTVLDNNGLWSTDGATTINLDTQVPANSVPSSTGAWYTTLGAVPALPVSASKANDYSGLTSLTCTNSANSSGTYSLSQGVSAGTSLAGTYPTSDIVSGTNTITCTSSTGAGNTTASTFTVLYDPATPSTQISSSASSSTWYSSLSGIPALNVSGTVGSSGVKTFTCTGDGVSSSWGAAGGGVLNLTGLSQGTGTISCTLTANNGLTSSSSYVLNYDSSTPVLTLSSSASQAAWYTSLGAIPAINASAIVGDSGLGSFNCSGDGISPQSYPTTAGGAIALAGLNQGTGQISCTVTSNSGLTVTHTYTLNYDPTPPTVMFTSTGSQTQWYAALGLVPSLNVSSSVGTSGLASFSCSGDGISTQTFPSTSGGQISLAGLNQGAGQITCTATANSGQQTAASYSIHFDPSTPTLTYNTTEDAANWYATSTLPDIKPTGNPGGQAPIAYLTCNGDGLPTNYTISAVSGTLPASDFNQGSGQISCTATSAAGITSSAQTLAVQIDNVVPSAAINTTADPSKWYATASSIPTLTATASTGPSGIEMLNCDGGGASTDVATTSATIDLSHLRDGTDTITCVPTNNAGVQGTAASFTVHLDTASPTVSFQTTANAARWYSSGSAIPSVSVNATAGASGLSQTNCSGDGITPQVLAYSGATLDLTGLNEGTGEISCTATNVAGQTGPPQTLTFNLDSTQPTAAWSTTEDETAWYSSTAAVPNISVSATTTGGSGVDHIACTGDGLGLGQTINGHSGTVIPTSLPNGSDTITCVPYSGAGVAGPAISRTILVDSTRPAIALSGTTGSAWYSSAQTVTADASADTNPSGVKSIACSVDGGTPTVTTGATATQAVSADGVHSLNCQPLSGANLVGQSATTTVRIDSQQPTVTQTIVPAPANQPTGSVDIQVAAGETNSLSGIASTSCSLDGQAPTVVSGAHQTVAITTAGGHTLDCTATTGAGVIGADVAQPYTVASDPTQFSLQYGAVATSWQSGTVTVPVQLGGSTAGNYRSVTCAINGSNATTLTGTSGTVPVSASGVDALDCYATGANGAKTAAVQQIVKIDNQQPTAAWSTAPTSTGAQVTLTAAEQTPLSGIASQSCAVDGGTPQTATTGTMTLTVNGNGQHQIACTITTGAGVSVNVTKALNISVPVAAPTTVSAPDPGRWYQAGQSIVIGIPTSGPTIASIVCAIDGASTTYPVNGSTVTVPVAVPGGHVQCYDVDPTGAQSNPVGFQVNIDSQPPTGYFVQTGPGKAIVTVTDPDNGSGVQTVTVQYQLPGGQWTTLPGSYDSASGQTVVTLPAALQQPGVTYTLQALAVDNAGNRSTINTLQDGAAATGSGGQANPYAGASLTGGLYAGTVAPGGRYRATKLVTVVRKVHALVNGKSVIERKHVKVTKHVWTINRAKLEQTLTTTYHQPVTLAGQLTLPSGSAASLTVTITEQTGKRVSAVKTVQTDSTGSFSVLLPAGASRTITYTVAGISHTARIREQGRATVKLRGGRKLTVDVAGVAGPVRYRLQHRRGARWVNVGGTRLTSAIGRSGVTLPASLTGVGAASLRITIATQPNWQYLSAKEQA